MEMKKFEDYHMDLIVKAIKANNMEERDRIVREKEKIRQEWLDKGTEQIVTVSEMAALVISSVVMLLLIVFLFF
jgi:hypothetical protein